MHTYFGLSIVIVNQSVQQDIYQDYYVCLKQQSTL